MTIRAVRFLLVMAGLVVGVALTHPAAALQLSPPSLEYQSPPGQVLTGEVKLYNETSAPLTLTTSTVLFGPKDESGQPAFFFDQPVTDLAAWIKIEAGPITLDRGARQTVPFTITIPAQAEPGGHYASIFFGTAPPAGSQVSIQSKLGALVILRVAGQVKESASLVGIELDGGRTKFNRLPTSFIVRVRNSGNVHLRPAGEIVITNMFGSAAARLPVNDLKGAILPNSIRRFETTWAKKSTDTAQEKNFFSEVGAEWRNFSVGTYTADVNLTYGQPTQTLSGQIKFTVFPWRLLLVLLLGLILLAMVLGWSIRRYNALIIRRAQANQPPAKTP